MSLVDRFKHGVDLTKFKADQALRIREVEGEISNVKREIAGVREQIASTALKLHKEAPISNPELEELCLQVDQLFEQIGSKENVIEAIRIEQPPQIPEQASQDYPGYPCPNCSFKVPVGAKFCTNCGQSMPEPSPTSEATSHSTARVCSNCGAHLDTAGAFCTQCGHNNAE
ncbi:MAG: zinc ribbon domain-containing protein [Anaerolineales bacterium]|nr:zinc ribbon domain-containing protein [Anaerolineales bacterium]